MGEGYEAMLYRSLYSLCAQCDPRSFDRAIFSREMRTIDQWPLALGVHVMKILPNPKIHQLVADVNQGRIQIYSEFANGFPGREDELANWHIYQSPILTLTGKNLSTAWRRVAKVIQRMSVQGGEPFHTALARNPNINLEYI